MVNARELIAALQRAGFVVRRQTGSHVTLRHADGRFAVVPRHPGDLGTGLLVSILRRALDGLVGSPQGGQPDPLRDRGEPVRMRCQRRW